MSPLDVWLQPMTELTFNVKSSYFCGFQVIFNYIKYKIVLNFSNKILNMWPDSIAFVDW